MKTGIIIPAITTITLALGCANQHEDTASTGRSRLTGPGATTTRADVIERARGWTDAGIPYCGGLPGGGDILCGGTCYRGVSGSATRRLDWDRYRSDCSGLVSYAWGLAPPGLTTWTLPEVSTSVALADIAPGDIFLSSSHTMLFIEWASPGVARFAEEADCGTRARVRQAATSETAAGIVEIGRAHV